MKENIRKCNNCGYTTLTMSEDDYPCKRCKIGKLEEYMILLEKE